MLRLILVGLIPFFMPASGHRNEAAFTAVEKVFPVHWKTDMGNVSFRSNFLLHHNEIIIGSNGMNFMDYQLIDKKSGVYHIDRRTGKIKKHFGNEVIGDMDVNGILEWNNRLYITNDNEEIICTTIDGNLIWSKPASGDIEHEPVMIKGKNESYIVYATETGEVKAIKPSDGSTIWSYYTTDFKGWKPEDNRMIFKIKSYLSNTYSFYTKPVLTDLNRDGINDLVYLTYGGDVYAINGHNGKLLWQNDKFRIMVMEKSPFSKETNSLAAIGVPRSEIEPADRATYYIRINANGDFIMENKISNTYSPSLNFYFNNHETMINTTDHLITIQKDKSLDSVNRQLMIHKTFNLANDDGSLFENTYLENRNHDDMLFTNRSFIYKNHGLCIINLIQMDGLSYEKGFIEIVSLETKQIVERLQLPSTSEMQPFIGDINQDGKLDLLINCKDGKLYCYNLGVKA
jgi:outer membrane protein assembly factor BamB